MLTSHVAPGRDYFAQQAFEADQEERAAFIQRLHGDAIQVTELGRPVHVPPGWVYQPPVNIPFVKSEVLEKGSEVMGSTALAVYQKMGDANKAIDILTDDITKAASMFGIENKHQARIYALECITRGKPPMTLAEEFDIVKGKLRRKAEAMLAKYRAAGGKCIWISDASDPTEQKAKWTFKENVDVVIGFTMAEANRAGLVKDDSGWEKYPAEMLQARAITKAVRRIAAEICNGAYHAPEEVSDDYSDPGFAPSLPESNGHVNGDVVDAEFHVAEGQPAVAAISVSGAEARSSTPPVEPATWPPTSCTGEQSCRINELCEKLGLNEAQRTAALKKRGANAVRNLSYEAARELCNSLEAKLAQVSKAIDVAVAEPSQHADAQQAYNAGPCTQPQIDKIKQLMRTTQDADTIKSKILAHLAAHGKSKLAELTISDAELLTIALEKHDLQMWADWALRPVNMDELRDTMADNGDTK